MARIPDIERRLLNWARWRCEGARIGSAGTERVDGEGWDAPTVIPTNDAEAAETERAVQSLEPTLREAVFDVYTGSGDMQSKARRRGVAVSTLFARRDTAHKCLQRWFDDARRTADAERHRVEALQAGQGRAPSIFASSVAAPSAGAAPSAAPRSRLAEWLAQRRAGGFTS